MSVEIVLTPLTDQGWGLMDALEAKTGKLPYQTNVNDGSRTYWLEADDAGVDAFDVMLDKIDSAWREHLARTVDPDSDAPSSQLAR